MYSCQGPLFWKFGRRFKPTPKQNMQFSSLTHSPTTRFSPSLFVVLQEILYQPLFALIRLLHKIMHLQSKTNFLNQFRLFGFDFSVLWICVSQGAFSQFYHHETTNSFIFPYIHSLLFDLSSNHTMWHDKRIDGHGSKITSCCCFFGFQRN